MDYQIITPVTSQKSRIDSLVSLSFTVGLESLLCYFKVAYKIEGEEPFGENFDSETPVILNISEIQKELNSIIEKVLGSRSQGLKNKDLVTKLISPDYKSFYSELLTTELFALTRQKADENLQINTAYTDFIAALINGMIGNENTIALQICLSNVLQVLEDNVQLHQLEALDNLIQKHRLPISRNTKTIG